MDISSEERSSAVDFVNRLNFLFEEWDIPKIVQTILPDARVQHFYGTLYGHSDIINFFKDVYPPLIPGISRHANNHVVDRDEETGGVKVRYHLHLARYAWPDDAEEINSTAGTLRESSEGLPAIWMWTTVIDRLVRSEDGWKVKERWLSGSVSNKELNPDTKSKK
jgi:hypothetical protein